MFLRRRSTQAEYCDQPGLSPAQVADNYRQLARFNRALIVADPFQRLLVRQLGRDRVASLSILDLGAGDGWTGRAIASWAERRGWDWRVVNLDRNLVALRLDPSARKVAADVCSLPFHDGSFDAVIASQMAHHLSDDETAAHFREAWRVTRDALFLTDAHRNPALLGAIWAILRLQGATRDFISDGLQSVRRGWRLGEWRALARQAGIVGASVWLYYGSRVVLQARKRNQSAEQRVTRPELARSSGLPS